MKHTLITPSFLTLTVMSLVAVGCAPVDFSSVQQASTGINQIASTSPTPVPGSSPSPSGTGGASGAVSGTNPSTPASTPMPPGSTPMPPASTPMPPASTPKPPGSTPMPPAVTIQDIRPALAVRGANCLLCHANIQSNFVTDFGLGTDNFIPAQYKTMSFFERTAYDNHPNTEPTGAWQSSVFSGTVYVPRYDLTHAQAMQMVGVNQAMSLQTMVNTPNLHVESPPMSVGITPQPGQLAVDELLDIKIRSPKDDEIQALIPAGNSPLVTFVGPVVNAPAGSSIQGLISVDNAKGPSSWAIAGSSDTQYVRNDPSRSIVECYGDIVIRGTLLLKNLNLRTDSGGCRLYVSKTVFIQGPITYVGSGANLQITSVRGVMMGISLGRMGAAASADVNGGAIRVNGDKNSFQDKIGGPYTRFSHDVDGFYDPTGAPDVRGKTFDNLILDGMQIGDELLDSADADAVNANPLPAGERVEPLGDEGVRVCIDYEHLLLNAPHVHSRYGGSFTGVIVADIAMFLLNKEHVNAHFIYDTNFDNTRILPALKEPIFSAKKP